MQWDVDTLPDLRNCYVPKRLAEVELRIFRTWVYISRRNAWTGLLHSQRAPGGFCSQISIHKKVVTLLALLTVRLSSPGYIPGTGFCYRLGRPWATGRPEGLYQWKNPITVVAQSLAQLRNRVTHSTHMVRYTGINMAVQTKSKLQHAATRSAAAWPPRGLCYRPTVVFRHLRLVALSLPETKTRRRRRISISFFTILKLRNLQLGKLGRICTGLFCDVEKRSWTSPGRLAVTSRSVTIWKPRSWSTGQMTKVLSLVFQSWYIFYITYPFSFHAVAQLVEVLRYKPEGRGFNSRWCHWKFSLIYSFRPHYGPWGWLSL
jgi:hypothetical protein